MASEGNISVSSVGDTAGVAGAVDAKSGSNTLEGREGFSNRLGLSAY